MELYQKIKYVLPQSTQRTAQRIQSIIDLEYKLITLCVYFVFFAVKKHI